MAGDWRATMLKMHVTPLLTRHYAAGIFALVSVSV